MSADEPALKRAIAFVDGQNLFRHAKTAFGHHHPNYDLRKLFAAICGQHGWQAKGIRFYTGVPGAVEDPMWHGYWAARILAMSRSGILVTKRTIRYHEVNYVGPDGKEAKQLVPHEKGIDVRLALDVVRLARQAQFDVGVIFSQDQDLNEVAAEVKDIAKEQQRWIKMVSAFPDGPNASYNRGVVGTDWVKIDQGLYDACLDSRDYRPKKT